MEAYGMGVIEYIVIVIVIITIILFGTLTGLFLRRLWKYLGRR